MEYGKRFHDIYKNVSEDNYQQTAAASETHHKEGYKSVEYAEKVLGIDFLDHVGDIILELNKLIPGFSKPEEVYGDRWFEFLKKKGIDPKTLEPIGKKSVPPRSKGSRENVEVLKRDGLKVELLSLLKALAYTNYSSGAVEKAVKELEEKIDGITSREGLSGEGLFEAGIYALALHYLKRRDFQRVKRLAEAL